MNGKKIWSIVTRVDENNDSLTLIDYKAIKNFFHSRLCYQAYSTISWNKMKGENGEKMTVGKGNRLILVKEKIIHGGHITLIFVACFHSLSII